MHIVVRGGERGLCSTRMKQNSSLRVEIITVPQSPTHHPPTLPPSLSPSLIGTHNTPIECYRMRGRSKKAKEDEEEEEKKKMWKSMKICSKEQRRGGVSMHNSSDTATAQSW